MYGGSINSMKIDAPDLKIISTDTEPALTCAVPTIFSNTKHMLRPWHLNETVVIHCKSCYQTDE